MKLLIYLEPAILRYKIVLSTLLFGAIGLGNNLHAAESESAQATWLYDFFSKGVQSAYAEYTMAIPQMAGQTAQHYQQLSYSIEYVVSEKTYEVRFTHEHRDDWNTLTHNGSTQPPKQTVYFTGSKIQPWTNSNGVGIYSEKYERKIQNWLVFENLDSLMMMQARAGNPLPPLNGMFYADELKHLKKKYKESVESGTASAVCSAFDFDHNGNVAGISRSYLMEFTNRKTNAVKNLADYTLSIRNNDEDVVFIDVLTSPAKNPVMEGLQFKSGDKKCTVFNFEINQCFSKFAPELVADPQHLIHNYLVALQESAVKPFARFGTTASK